MRPHPPPDHSDTGPPNNDTPSRHTETGEETGTVNNGVMVPQRRFDRGPRQAIDLVWSVSTGRYTGPAAIPAAGPARTSPLSPAAGA